MKNKLLFVIFFFTIIYMGKVSSQENREATLSGYNNQNYYLYFDSIAKLIKYDELDRLNNSYHFYVTFKVDIEGKVMEFEIIEVPGAEVPGIVKEYIYLIIKSTDRNWIPQIKNNNKIVSDKLVYLVSLVKKNQNLRDKVKDSEPVIEYFFGSSEKKNEKVEQLILFDNKKYISLFY
jgi:hypothetical protein